MILLAFFALTQVTVAAVNVIPENAVCVAEKAQKKCNVLESEPAGAGQCFMASSTCVQVIVFKLDNGETRAEKFRASAYGGCGILGSSEAKKNAKRNLNYTMREVTLMPTCN